MFVGEVMKTVGGWLFGVLLCLVAVQPVFNPLLEHCHVVEFPSAGLVGVAGFGVPIAQYAPLGNVSVAV